MRKSYRLFASLAIGLLSLFGVQKAQAVGPIIGYVQITTGAQQTGGFYTQNGTVSSFTVTGLSPSQCVQTGVGGLLTTSGLPCGSGSGVGSTTGTITNASQFSVGYYSATGSSNIISGLSNFTFNGTSVTAAGITTSSLTVTGPVVIPNLGAILNQSTLQSGATLYTSSATVLNLNAGDGNTNNPLTVNIVAGSNTATGLAFLGRGFTGGDANIDYLTGPGTIFSRLKITNTNDGSGPKDTRRVSGWDYMNGSQILASFARVNGGDLTLNATGQINLCDGPSANCQTIVSSNTNSVAATFVLPDSPATSTGALVYVHDIAGTREDLAHTSGVTTDGSNLTVNNLTINGTCTGGACAGGGALETLVNGVQVDSPTKSINIGNGIGVIVNGANVGASTASYTLSLDPNATNYIQNTSSLQSGATFYVSSGAIAGQLFINPLSTQAGLLMKGVSLSSGSGNGASATTMINITGTAGQGAGGSGQPTGGGGSGFTMTTGAGGAVVSTNMSHGTFFHGGVAGQFSISGGIGGSGTIGHAFGGGGGAISAIGGIGGASDIDNGGSGGAVTFTGGTGGISSTNTAISGSGGAVNINGGAGGSDSVSASTSGIGGNILIIAGDGGIANGGAIQGNGGYLNLESGSGSAPGTIYIGTGKDIGSSFGEQIVVGNATSTTTFSGIISSISVVGGTTVSYEASFSTTTSNFHVAISTNGHIVTFGPLPSVSSCGSTPNGSVVGDDNHGTITVGGTAPTACTLTFANSWGTTPTCTVTDNSLTIADDISSISPTQMVLGFGVGGLAGGTVYYHCGCSGKSCL